MKKKLLLCCFVILIGVLCQFVIAPKVEEKLLSHLTRERIEKDMADIVASHSDDVDYQINMYMLRWRAIEVGAHFGSSGLLFLISVLIAYKKWPEPE